ncbi:hypothetical protein KHP57_14080, partial [Algiphilus sp. NNCM1]|nr:hypothetical protein [Algiphilus acroporae]
TSLTGRASVSRRMRTICSSLNRLFLICLCSVCRGHLLKFQMGRESAGRSPEHAHRTCNGDEIITKEVEERA